MSACPWSHKSPPLPPLCAAKRLFRNLVRGLEGEICALARKLQVSCFWVKWVRWPAGAYSKPLLLDQCAGAQDPDQSAAPKWVYGVSVARSGPRF